jgi:hypothetical protein
MAGSGACNALGQAAAPCSALQLAAAGGGVELSAAVRSAWVGCAGHGVGIRLFMRCWQLGCTAVAAATCRGDCAILIVCDLPHLGSSLGVPGGLGGSLLGQADSNALKVRSLLHAECSAVHKYVLLHTGCSCCKVC